MNHKLGKIMFFFALLQPLVALLWMSDVTKNISWYDVVYWPVFAVMAIAVLLTLSWHAPNRFNLNMWIALLVLNGLLSVMLNIGKLSVLDFSFVSSFLVLFLTAPYVLSSEERFALFIKILLIVLLVPATLGYLQRLGLLPYYYIPDWIGEVKVNRLTGGFSHPNTYGYYITFGIAAALYLFEIHRIKWQCLTGWLFYVLPTVFYTYHRATWVTTMAIFFMYLAVGKKGKRKIALVVPVMILGLFAARMVAGLDTGFAGGDLRGRAFIYALYLGGYISSGIPQLLFGHGSPQIRGYGVLGAHDDFLNALYIYGFIGFLLLLIFIIAAARNLLSRYREASGGRKALAFFGLVLLVDYLLFSITAEPMREYYFYFFFALALSYVDWFTANEERFRKGQPKPKLSHVRSMPGLVCWKLRRLE